MSTFETNADARKEVEKRLGQRLADVDWLTALGDLHGPFDDVDLREILDAAYRLPALRAKQAARLKEDVERLRRQIPVYSKGRLPSRLYLAAVEAVESLQQGFAADGEAVLFGHPEQSDDPMFPSPLLRTYFILGSVFHEHAAIDWLAKRHGISTMGAFYALKSELGPDEAMTFGEGRESVLAILSPMLVRLLKIKSHASREIQREMASGNNATRCLLEAISQHKRADGLSNQQAFLMYRDVRQSLVESLRPEQHPREYATLDAFKKALQRLPATPGQDATR